ncbi:Free methionine-(R)-sulfoxide reductase [Mucinivorans hirudinis]|uniref:Free methionine-(R)-sulfoxide reductase n=1 Tax=Mucinivorans hirudinis TaxID=1433126 RepID=A0A060RCC0_9BACT|nr:Free methionine-(R)-sulfoxide reductase [Mucinivorans hirudinis]
MKNIIVPKEGTRAQIYETIIPQIESLVAGEEDLIANLANITAVLKGALGFFWIGFYLVKGDELVLAPFQGTPACTRIKRGRGVCGAAWEQERALLVADVNKFPGHIACSSHSKSEVVIPIFRRGEVFAVLDIDSDKLDDFSQTDIEHLELLADIVGKM